MFRNEKLRAALEAPGKRRVRTGGAGLPPFLLEETRDRWPLRLAVGLALLLHLGFFALRLPELSAVPQYVAPQQAHYVVRQVRFRPPAPRQQVELPRPQERRRKIPVPDPTPDEPEPIVTAEIEAPEVLDPSLLDGLFVIPEGPPGAGAPARREGVLQVDGEVEPPERMFAPSPTYTEEGRHARIQGVVILEAIIDAMGKVDSVRVLKDLPMGLGEAAVEAVSHWQFRPATLHGTPVAVYYNLTVSFSLQ